MVLTDEVWVVAGACVPEGRGDVAGAPSSEGTVAAVGGGEVVTSSATAPGCDPPASTHVGEAGRAIPAVGCDEVTTNFVAAPGCDPLASTRVGGARRAAPRRAMRTHHACLRGRLPRRNGGVGVGSGREDVRAMAIAGRGEVGTPEPNHVSRWERIRGAHGNVLDLLAIPGD